ncbi:MAG: HAMP domain-containing sensor histidine kinase, partial [Acidobacteria bacterium]|nr:HAMP domain-containing sensor histidine kinase [Acidobacteriota bacterium]
VILTFDDTGDGIPAAARRQLFTPFFTTKPGGTGIGLAISRRVVEAHGGSIQCESTEGHGTTFRIALPVQQAVVDEFSSID